MANGESVPYTLFLGHLSKLLIGNETFTLQFAQWPQECREPLLILEDNKESINKISHIAWGPLYIRCIRVQSLIVIELVDSLGIGMAWVYSHLCNALQKARKFCPCR